MTSVAHVRIDDMRLTAVFASAAALMILAQPAQASCVPSTEREHLARAAAVFVGRVTSVNATDGSARFKVLSVRKGRIKARLDRPRRAGVLPVLDHSRLEAQARAALARLRQARRLVVGHERLHGHSPNQLSTRGAGASAALAPAPASHLGSYS